MEGTVRGPASGRETLRWLAGIAALAVVARLIFAFAVYPRIASDFALELGDSYDQIALNLAEGHGYREDPREPPTLRRLPLYPLLLAGIFAMAGPSLGAVQVAQALLGAAACVVVFGLGRRLYGTPAATLATALTALHPSLVHYAGRYYTETLYTLLLALFVLAWTAALARERVPDARARGAIALWLATGVFFGLAALTRGNAVLLPLPFALVVLRRLGWRRAPGALAAFAVALAAVVSPWSGYASRLAGEPVLLSTWGAAPFYHGLYVSRRVTSGRSLGDLDREAGERLVALVGRARGLEPADQVRRERAVMEVVRDETRAAPLAIAAACLRGLLVTWIWARSPWTIALHVVLHLPLLALGALGARTVRSRDDLGPLLATVAYFAAFQACYYPQARYVLPVVPLLAIPAAAAVVGWGTGWRTRIGEGRA
jgi:4-amino-4-deoxy-L-arabinose transferase-like glycosyltransferase